MAKGIQTQGLGWTAVIAIIAGVVNQLMDGDPTTIPDWNLVIPGILASIGVARSRAKNQTSEEAKAVK